MADGITTFVGNRLMLLPCCVYVADVITTVAGGIATVNQGD